MNFRLHATFFVMLAFFTANAAFCGETAVGFFVGTGGGTAFSKENAPSAEFRLSHLAQCWNADAGIRYAAGILDATGSAKGVLSFFSDKPVSLSVGAGPLLHLEFVESDAFIADLLAAATVEVYAVTGTRLSVSMGYGYRQTIVYALLDYDDVRFTDFFAMYSVSLSQTVGGARFTAGIGTASYFYYPLLTMPQMWLRAEYCLDKSLTVLGEALWRFTSVSSQKNTQVEHVDFRMGVSYAL